MSQADPTAGWSRTPWPRAVLLLIGLVAAGWFAVTQGQDVLSAVRAWIADIGWIGAPALVPLCAIAVVLLFPLSLFAVLAGALLGPAAGLAVAWLGGVLGAFASFEIGRVMSRDAVERVLGDRAERLSRFFAARGTFAVAYLRIVPVFPFALINYGAGVTRLTRRQFVVGTGIGTVPALALWVFLGDAVTDPGSPQFLIAVVLLTVLIVVGGVLARRMQLSHRAQSPAE